MTSFTKKYAYIWGNNPKQLMSEYNFQNELTDKLDDLDIEEFNREIFYEIVLWKLNRHPKVEDSLLLELKTLSLLKPKQHRESLLLLKKLLSCHGIRLPMASTILRFINPNVFQIIDDRVQRVLELKIKIPNKPTKINEGYLTKCCNVYFDYLDELQKYVMTLCRVKTYLKKSKNVVIFYYSKNIQRYFYLYED